MPSDVSERLRHQVADRAYHVCEYCLVHEEDTFWGCQVDHIVSRKRGGATEPGNLAWACACCNNSKGTDVATLVGQPPRLVRLFHPRSDRWGDCFVLSGVRVDPANVTGEGTTNLLQLNHATRLRERETLAEAGRYPQPQPSARFAAPLQRVIITGITAPPVSRPAAITPPARSHHVCGRRTVPAPTTRVAGKGSRSGG